MDALEFLSEAKRMCDQHFVIRAYMRLVFVGVTLRTAWRM